MKTTARSIAPIAQTLHLKLLASKSTSPNFDFPNDLRSLCLSAPCELKHLPKNLRSLCVHVPGERFRGNAFFADFHTYLPKLQTLALVDFNGAQSMDGEPILLYLHTAKHLIELRLYSRRFDIELNNFYERALEIIEQREDKLPLKIFHGGETIVRNDSSKLKLFNTSSRCGDPASHSGTAPEDFDLDELLRLNNLARVF